jgi:hypothetical protein
MIVQRKSLEQVITRAKRAGKPVVAGGPHPASYWEDMADVDYFLLGEVEETFPRSTPPCKPYTCLCPGVFHNRRVCSPLAGDASKEHGRAHCVLCASPLHACNAPPVVRLPSSPARFSHDCNICSQNVTDGAGRLRYSVPDERVALQGVSDVPGRQRYPCMEAMW